MSPLGAASMETEVDPPPTVRAKADALCASRPTNSTAFPPAIARAPRTFAMFPRPMMLMLAMIGLPPTFVAFVSHCRTAAAARTASSPATCETTGA